MKSKNIRTAIVISTKPDRMRFITSILIKTAISVHGCNDIPEVLAVMQEIGSPDIVITDLTLPEIDDWRLLWLLHSSAFPEFNHIPILVVSDAFASTDLAQLRYLGADGFLPLPASPSRLSMTVHCLMEGKPGDNTNEIVVVGANPRLELVQNALKTGNRDIRPFISGDSSLQFMAEICPEIVILFDPLTDMSIERYLAESRRLSPYTPIVLVSNLLDKPAALRFLKLGLAGFIHEPASESDLRECCRRVSISRSMMEMQQRFEAQCLELEARENRYELLFEKMISGFFLAEVLHDELGKVCDFQFIETNSAFREIIGATRKELVGKGVRKIFSDGDPEWFIFFDSVQATGEPVEISRYCPSLDKYLKISAFRPEPGYCAGAVVDISEQKIADEALQKRQDRINSIFQAAPILIGVTVNRVITEVNDRIFEMLGYMPEEIIGKNSRILYPDQAEFEYVGKEKYQQISDRGVGSVETHWVRKDGKVIDIILSSSPIDPNDHSAGITFTALDITERRYAEAERATLQEQLNQAQRMEAVGHLAGGIAHDFNNLLTVIIGYIQMLLYNIPEDSHLFQYAEMVHSASEKAAELTHNLLAFSRKQVIEPKPVDINEMVTKISRLMARLIGEDIEIHLDLWPEPLIISADSCQLEQVLMNLATNARDAMPFGGSITIRTESRHLNEDFINIYGWGTAGDYSIISFRDTGTGIPDTIRERIFEPFFTTKEMGKGTGLGLSMVHGIIRQHNGYINLESTPGEGTVFTLYLPIIASDSRTEPRFGSSLPVGGKETILIAEDDSTVRSLCKMILEQEGYTVIEAVDGQDAVDKFTEHADHIGLIIIDVVMPKKNGSVVYDEIRQMRPDAKILLTSGYTADLISQKGIYENNVNFLSKPISPMALLLRVREILDGA